MKENQSHEARRRAFIRDHHPDRGGDPGAFIAGLRTLDAEREQGSGPLPKVVVVRRRAWLVRKATVVVRRLRYGPRPSRVRLPGVSATALLPGPTDTRFFERAGMEGTGVDSSDKDDPADVAKDGFEALMAGRSQVVAGSAKNKVQAAAAKLMPDHARAATHARMTKPKGE
jgi:hypothetical protein